MPETVIPDTTNRAGAVKGFLWVLAGTFLFTVIMASGKFIGEDVPSLQVSFFRYLGALLSTGLMIFSRREGGRVLRTAQLPRHALRALFGASGLACALYAATTLPLADASAISLTQGMFVFLLGAWILRERVGMPDFIALLVCATGGYVVIQAGTGATSITSAPALPVLAALAGALLIACEVLMIKSLTASERPETMIFIVSGFGSLLLLVPTLLSWHSPTPVQLVELCLLGPLAVLAQYCNIRGYQLAAASFLGSATYSRLIFSLLIGLLAFGEYPNAATLIGAVMIIIGSMALTFLHSRSPRRRSG